MKLETKFQDKDFDFGEIVKAKVTTYYDENKVVVMADRARGGVSRFEYNSIKEFTDHWEDVPEEPKKYWYIDFKGEVKEFELLGFEWQGCMKEIGNYFGTKEEAEKAVEKLKALRRLKDKGFKITLHGFKGNGWLQANWDILQGDYSDVLILFGGTQ